MSCVCTIVYVTEYGQCSPGTYNSGGNCYSCNGGCACPDYDDSSSCPQTCVAGYYCPAGSSNVYQNNCPPGSYCPQGASAPIACTTAGYYCPLFASSPTQYICAGGYYGSGSSLTSSTCTGACNAGYYCPSGSTSPNQYICPAGHYCPATSSTPIPCAGGTYGVSQGLSSNACTGTCTAGYFCPAGSSSSTTYRCPAGYYCGAGAANAIPCPAGNWSSMLGAISIANCNNTCPPGFYCPPGSSSGTAFACYAGYFCSGGSTTPTQFSCPAGYYCPNATAIPLLCKQLGYYCPVNSPSNTSYICPAGVYGNTSGLIDSSCTDVCPSGYFCLNGTWNPLLSICPIGYYCPSGTQYATQYPCPGGRFGNVSGLTTSACSGECLAGFDCPVGSISPTQITCPAGFFCVSGVGAPSVCNVPGFYCPENTKSPTRYRCLGGHYGSTAPMIYSNCSGLCWGGYYCAAGSSTPTQYICPSGYYCPNGTTNPISCIPGSYCPFGTYNPAQFLCPAGRYGNVLNLATAACSGNCTAGFYCPTGSTSPTQIICPAGHLCLNGTAIPAVCNTTGYYCPVGTSSATQWPCAAGFYGNSIGLNSSTCSGLCAAGYYGNSTGASTPMCNGPCAPGYYCSAGSTTAFQFTCPFGYYCPAGTNYIFQYPCPAGTYGNASGLTSAQCVDVCPLGYFCPVGTFNVIPCPAGTFCSGGVGATPPVCNISGYYCPQNAPSATAFPCDPGFYGASAPQNFSTCTGPCSPGYYCPPNSTSATQIPCPAGSYCVAASASPLVCNTPGYWCPPKSNSSAGVPCAAGYYGNSSGLTSAQCSGMCSAGAFCPPASNSSVLFRCTRGYYCPPGTQNATQYPCAPGHFGINTGRLFAECDGACAPGYFCLAGSTNQTQFICPIGYYCPAASGSPLRCPLGTYSLSVGAAACENMIAQVGSISSGVPNGYYSVGSTVDIVINFILVRGVFLLSNPSASSLALGLEKGRIVYATYASGNGTLAFHYTYTIASGDTSYRLRTANFSILTGVFVGPDFNSSYNASTVPKSNDPNSLFALNNIVVAGTADSSSTIRCASSGVAVNSNLSCIFTPMFQGISFVFPTSQFSFFDSRANGTVRSLVPVGTSIHFTYFSGNYSVDTLLTVFPCFVSVNISIFNVIDSTSLLVCSPVVVSVASQVNCTTYFMYNSYNVTTNNFLVHPTSIRSIPVANSGGPGVFSPFTSGIITSAYSFTYITPLKSGPMFIWDAVSGNQVLLQVYEPFDGQIFAVVDGICQ